MAETKGTENTHLPHDSMVTVRLSEPPSLTVDTQSLDMNTPQEPVSALETPSQTLQSSVDESPDSECSSLAAGQSILEATEEDGDSNGAAELLPDEDERRGSDSTEGSGDNEVNWAELEKTEEQEPRDQDSEDVSTGLHKLDDGADPSVYGAAASSS